MRPLRTCPASPSSPWAPRSTRTSPARSRRHSIRDGLRGGEWWIKDVKYSMRSVSATLANFRVCCIKTAPPSGLDKGFKAVNVSSGVILHQVDNPVADGQFYHLLLNQKTHRSSSPRLSLEFLGWGKHEEMDAALDDTIMIQTSKFPLRVAGRTPFGISFSEHSKRGNI